MDEIFNAGASDYLIAGGEPATYHSMLLGDIPLTVVISDSVQAIDDGAGAYVPKLMATIKAGLVTPKRGDVIETASARYSVEQVVDGNSKFMLDLWIQKKP